MLNRITGRSTASFEFRQYIAEAKRMVEEYGWQDKTVWPYGSPVKVTDMLREFTDYDRCTSGSKDIMISEANGLAKILNTWERTEKQPKVKIRNTATGKIVMLPAEFAEYLTDDCEVIEGGN